MTQRYVWRVLCPIGNQYETTVSAIQPIVCPSDGVTPVDPAFTTIMQSEFYDITSPGYVNVESQLADNQAVKISASDVNGGIDINAGIGGITVDTTNSISLNAGAASDFTATNGNLILQATLGLLNMDGGSGINLGNGSTTTPILIGTTSFAKNINIGNQTSTSTTDIVAGTGGVNIDTANGGSISLDTIGASSNFTITTNADAQDLTIAVTGNTDSSVSIQSSGTGTDAINLETTNGGIQATAFGTTGSVELGTNFSGSGHIKLSSGAGGSGNITLESGSSGISVNAYNGGAIGLGHFNGGDMFIGTAAAQRTIKIGNSTGATTLFERFGTGGFIKHQSAPTALADSDATLTSAQLLTRLVTIAPTVTRTLTLPAAATIIGDIAGLEIDDSIDFIIINDSTPVNEAFLTISPGTNGTTSGNMSVAPKQNNAATYFTSGSSGFRLRFTDVSTGNYVIYRIS